MNAHVPNGAVCMLFVMWLSHRGKKTAIMTEKEIISQVRSTNEGHDT